MADQPKTAGSVADKPRSRRLLVLLTLTTIVASSLSAGAAATYFFGRMAEERNTSTIITLSLTNDQVTRSQQRLQKLRQEVPEFTATDNQAMRRGDIDGLRKLSRLIQALTRIEGELGVCRSYVIRYRTELRKLPRARELARDYGLPTDRTLSFCDEGRGVAT